MNMKQDLEQQLKQLGQELTPSASLKSGVMSRISGTQKQSIQPLSIWRRIMKSPVTKIGSLAATVVVCLLIHSFIGNGSGVIWADVIKKLENIHTFKYRERDITSNEQYKNGITFASMREYEVIVRASKKWGRRRDTYFQGELGLTTIMSYSQGNSTTLFYGQNRYKLEPLEPLVVAHFQKDDPHQQVIRCFNQTPELYDLGEQTIEGVVCEGVEIRDPNIFTWSPAIPKEFAMRIWINLATEYPVMIEKEFRMPGRSEWTLRIMDQFEWNVALDANLFDVDIPADYSLMEETPTPPQSVSKQTSAIDDQTTTLVNGLILLGVEPNESSQPLVLTGMKGIWNTQDRIIATWPSYEEVKDRLVQELTEKLAEYDFSFDQNKAIAIALRERFWAEGGCLSETSYPYVYAARLMCEELHYQMPKDMSAANELIETLQSAEFTVWFDPDMDEKHVNVPLLERLVELRSQQFDQIQEELESGRTVTWSDFLCVNDLALALGRLKQYDQALPMIQWLIDNAEAGQWTGYLEPLEMAIEAFSQGDGCNYNVLSATGTDFPEEFRYHRQLPSFKGPQSRGAVIDKNPVWSWSPPRK